MYLRICMDVYLLVSICFWIEAGGGRHRGPVSTCRGAAAGLWSIALLLIAFKWGLGGLGGGRGFLCSTSRFDQDCKHWFSLSPTSKMCNQADVIVVIVAHIFVIKSFHNYGPWAMRAKSSCCAIYIASHFQRQRCQLTCQQIHTGHYHRSASVTNIEYFLMMVSGWYTVVVRCSFDKDVKAFVAFWWKRFVLTLSRPNIPGKSHILGKFNTITLKMEIILRMMMTETMMTVTTYVDDDWFMMLMILSTCDRIS